MVTKFIDIQDLKTKVSLVDVAQMLGLKLIKHGNQFRCACPVHGGGDRALAVTPGQGFKCWASGMKGGDQIGLVAHIKECGQRDAAETIETHFKFTATSSTVPDTVPPAPARKQGFDPAAYLRGLDPAAEALSDLGISPVTLTKYRGGYSKTGVNRGRLALAMCDPQGAVLGFCGRAIGQESQPLIFPTGFQPESVVFGVDHIEGGEVRMVRDVLDVLNANDLEEPAICFLTGLIEPQQHEMLASLQDQRKFKVFY